MNVLSPEKIALLKAAFEARKGQRQIERETGISGSTIRRWYFAWLDGNDLLVEREVVLKSGSVGERGPRGPYKPRKPK